MKASIAARAPMFLAAILMGSVAVAQDDKPVTHTTPPSNVVVVPPILDITGKGLPSGFASSEQLMKAQLPLTDAASKLDEVIRRYPGTGFGEIVLDVSKGLVRVLWKEGQEIPAELATLVDRLGAQDDVDVVVDTVPYSKEELRAEAKRIFLQASETPGLIIARIEPLADYQGLKVEVENPVAEVARLSLFTGAPIPIELGSGKRPALLSRWDDSAPWYGGAGIRNGFGSCSTGFGVWYDGWFSDDYYVLTAAHCSHFQNGISFMDGNYDPLGTIPGSGTNGPETRISEYDTIAIKVSSSGSRIFDGGVYFGEFTKPVHGATDPWVGEYLCTSGAYSGALCGIVVKSKDAYYYSTGGARLHGPMVRAEQVDYLAAAGEGDSGGPVFALSPNDGVIAKGTISGGNPYDRPASCTGITSIDGQARLCSWDVVFTPIWTALIVNNVDIRKE